MSTVSKARHGGPLFKVDGKRVRITISNDSGGNTWAAGEQENAKWIIRSDAFNRLPHPTADKDKRQGR